VCYAGLVRATDPVGRPLLCGYARCGQPAVARAPRVGFVCAGHLDRPVRRQAGKTTTLAEDIRTLVAERDTGGRAWQRFIWMGPGSPPWGPGGAIVPAPGQQGPDDDRMDLVPAYSVRPGDVITRHPSSGEPGAWTVTGTRKGAHMEEDVITCMGADGSADRFVLYRLHLVRIGGERHMLRRHMVEAHGRPCYLLAANCRDQDVAAGHAADHERAGATLPTRHDHERGQAGGSHGQYEPYPAAGQPGNWRSFTRENLAQRIGELACYLSGDGARQAATQTANGHASGITAARAVLAAICQTATQAAVATGSLSASLADADLDLATLGEVTGILETACALRDAAEKALAGLNARHARVEEAICTTPHAAKLSFYRH